MALLNYTTQIEAIKTVGEIQGILAIKTDYSDEGQVEALSFLILTPHGEIGIRLPIDPEAVLKVLTQQNRLGRDGNVIIRRPYPFEVEGN